MKSLKDTLGSLKNINYKKMLNSKTFLIAGSVVLLIAAFIINMAVGNVKPNVENEASGEQTTKILGNSVLVDNNVGDVPSSEDTASQNDFFASEAINREKVRDEAMGVLRTIIDSPDTLADTKERAVEDMAEIVADMTAEANAETLIKSKGFDDCVVVISGGSANVIVKSDELQQKDVAQILDAVYSESGIAPSKIKIVKK